jgi:hypothetical protein
MVRGPEITTDDPEDEDGLAKTSRSSAPPRVGVYAAAVGLATAVPLPFVDRALSGLARGAALRRVAKRRGVRLSRGARDILSGGRAAGDAKARWLRSAIASAFAPVRIASRVDDAVSMWSAAVLLDHHLASAERPACSALSAHEAERVRCAMDSAAVDAVLESLRVAPGGIAKAVADAFRAAAALDHEDRSPLERAVDTFLDAAADSPDAVIDRLKTAFDRAYRKSER